jgi:hypothetical protein
MTLRHALASALLLAAAGAACAAAQPGAWRCDGDTPLYTDRPCAGGRPVEAAGEPSALARAQAGETARRERALAETLRAERLGREARAPQGPPPGIRMATTEARGDARRPAAETRPRGVRPASRRQQPAAAPTPRRAPARLTPQAAAGTAQPG